MPGGVLKRNNLVFTHIHFNLVRISEFGGVGVGIPPLGAREDATPALGV